MDKWKNHSKIGKSSLIMSILAIFFLVPGYLIYFPNPGSAVFYINIITLLSLLIIFGIIFLAIAIVLGLIAFFGKNKDKYGLIGIVIGIVFFILLSFGYIITN